MYFTPLRIENSQSVSSSSLITAPEGGVLNERRCNKSLFRVDLQIHHIIGSIAFGFMAMYIPIPGSMALINECISLLNNVLRNHPYWLNRYRLFCILCIRLPVCGFFTLYYIPYRFYEFKGSLTDDEYWFVYNAHKINYLFLLYDFYLIKTIVQNLRKRLRNFIFLIIIHV
jgi:hypothetical protein